MKNLFKMVSIFGILLAITVLGVYSGYLYINAKGKLSANISQNDFELIEKKATTKYETEKTEDKIIPAEPTIKAGTKIIYNYKNASDNSISEEIKTPTKAMIGLNQEVFEKTLDEFKIVDFNEDAIVVEKTINSPVMYAIGNSNGRVAIYYYDENKDKKLKQETLTLVSTLPDYDQNLINNGINVANEVELISILDDYEN